LGQRERWGRFGKKNFGVYFLGEKKGGQFSKKPNPNPEKLGGARQKKNMSGNCSTGACPFSGEEPGSMKSRAGKRPCATRQTVFSFIEDASKALFEGKDYGPNVPDGLFQENAF